MATKTKEAKTEPTEPTTLDPRLSEMVEAARRAAGADAAEPKADADATPEPEAPEGPQPPHPDAKLIAGQWMLRRRGRTYIARPAIRPDGRRDSRSIYQPVELGAILDDATPLCDQPGRLETALDSLRMVEFALYDDSPVDQEVDRLRASGFDHMADLLRERHPQQAERPPYGPLDIGRVQASMSLHRLGRKASGESLRGLLRRHAGGDWGDRGKLAEVELDADKREFPGAFGPAALNAVSLERNFGLVWSTYSGADVVDDPRWRDDRRLHIATILGGSARTFVWAAPFDHVSTS